MLVAPSMNLKQINTTALNFEAGQAALQLAIDELNSTKDSITKALSSSISRSPLAGPRLSVCRKLVHHSLCRLNSSLTYKEMDNLMAAMKDIEKCLFKLEEIDDMVVAIGGEDEMMMLMGVDEVKLGVEKAKELIVNSTWLFDRRDDFYSPFLEFDHDYSFDQNFLIGYKFLTGMYCLMYLVLALLFFFLIWRGK